MQRKIANRVKLVALGRCFREGFRCRRNTFKAGSEYFIYRTYRLPDLLDYTRIYHLAKLIELHRHAVWASSLDEPLMHRNRLLFDIRGIVLSSIHDLGLSLDCKKEASIDSLALTELIQCITNLDEVAELESVVESHLRRMFKV